MTEKEVIKAGICLDDWKLPIFRKRLTEAGFEYTDAGAFTAAAALLTIMTDDVPRLRKVLEGCHLECKAAGPPKGMR